MSDLPPATGGPGGPSGRLRRDTVLVAVGQLVAVVSAFLLVLVGARVLSVEDFGALSWALSWLAYLAVLAQLGLTQVATIVLAGPAARGAVRLLRRLLLVLGLGVAGTGLLWALLLGPAAASAGTPTATYRPLVLAVALWLPVAAAGPVLVNALRARGRFGASLVYGEHVRRTVVVALLAATAAGLWRPPLAALLWVAVAAESLVYLACGVVLVRALRARGAAAAPAQDRPSSSWEVLRLGRQFLLATLASATVPQAGVWLLAAFAPVQEVAVLSVAVRIAVLLAVPTAVGMRVLAPRVAAASRAGRLDALAEPVRRFAVWSTVATVLPVVLLAATGEALLPGLFGDGYGAALVPALVLSAGVVVNAWTGPCSVVLSHAGHERVVARSALASALAFLALSAWWAPGAGATGVAAAAAVAMSGRNLHLAGAAARRLGMRTIALPSRKGS